MYPLLRQGCVLPSVTALQILLNRGRTQNKLQVDGVFGPLTANAVREFQRMKGIGVDGIVGVRTWPLLTQRSQLKVIDTVDTTDSDVMLPVVGNLLAAGADPIVQTALCGGVSALVSRILARAAQSGATVLLRISGHGGPGGQYVSGGRVAWVSKRIEGYQIDKTGTTMKDSAGNPVAWKDGKNWKDKDGKVIAYALGMGDDVTLQAHQLNKNLFVISPHNPGDVRGVEPVLGRLRDIFVGFGSVELHGCSVGAGLPWASTHRASVQYPRGTRVGASSLPARAGRLSLPFSGPRRHRGAVWRELAGLVEDCRWSGEIGTSRRSAMRQAASVVALLLVSAHLSFAQTPMPWRLRTPGRTSRSAS